MITALKWVAGLLGLLVSLVSLTVGLLIIATVVSEAVSDRIVLESFSTPKFFQENGYSDVVAARKVRQSLIKIHKKSATLFESRELSELQLAWKQPNIAIPQTDVAAEWVIKQLKGMLKGKLTTVGGDFVCHHNHLALNLRIERLQQDTSYYVHIDTPENSDSGCRNTKLFDRLVKAAAEHIWEQLQPYVFAVYLYRNNELVAAERIVRRLVTLPPPDDDHWAYNLWGLIEKRRAEQKPKRSEKTYAQADRLFSKAIEIDPAFVLAKVNLARTALEAGRTKEAIAIYDSLSKTTDRSGDPTPAYILSLKGEAFLRIGPTSMATDFFRRAVAQEPDNAGYHFNLGLTLITSRKFGEALEEFEIAIALDPRHIKARHNLGETLFELQSKEAYRRAAIVYGELVRLGEKGSDVYYNWGLALELASYYAAAEEKYRRAIRKNPDSAKYSKVLGDALFAQGRYVDALKSYTQAARLDPEPKLQAKLLDLILMTKEKLN